MDTDPAGEAPSAVPLTRQEKRKARARTAVSPQVVHEAIRREGEEELVRPTAALVWSAVAAGLSMGFSLVGEGILHAALPDAPWRPLVAKLGYSLGFLFVILGRQQLFTENTLLVILPLLARPRALVLRRVARVWALVLAGNLAGAVAFAASMRLDVVGSPALRAAFAEIGRKALEPGFAGVLVRGIYGGWLIALMVWLLPAARFAKFFVVVTVTWLVGAGEFSHVIAGSVEVFFLVVTGQIGVGTFLGGFFLPALVGNSIGGVALVAALNHAQVVAGHAREGGDGDATRH
jgi:formate-nitrite transporter family protein